MAICLTVVYFSPLHFNTIYVGGCGVDVRSMSGRCEVDVGSMSSRCEVDVWWM